MRLVVSIELKDDLSAFSNKLSHIELTKSVKLQDSKADHKIRKVLSFPTDFVHLKKI